MYVNYTVGSKQRGNQTTNRNTAMQCGQSTKSLWSELVPKTSAGDRHGYAIAHDSCDCGNVTQSVSSISTHLSEFIYKSGCVVLTLAVLRNPGIPTHSTGRLRLLARIRLPCGEPWSCTTTVNMFDLATAFASKEIKPYCTEIRNQSGYLNSFEPNLGCSLHHPFG